MQCVILAGGLGTRMRRFTDGLPKALLDVCGQPFVHYQLQLLREHGVTEVVACIGYKGDLIRRFVGDGRRWGITVTYIDEGSQLLGTAGALRLALDAHALTDRFLVLYGDSYLPAAIDPVWAAARSASRPALMTVFRNSGQWDKSNVIYRDGVVALYDKSAPDPEAIGMRHIDYGLSVFDRDVIRTRVRPRVKRDLAHLLHSLSLEGQLAGFEVTERFYEIGSPRGLRDLQLYLSAKNGVR